MNVGLNAAQARSKANSDMIIYDEVQYIMKKIITESTAGNYSVVIGDGTTMTDSSPEVVLTGTIANPTVVVGETLIINGSTITLGTTGTNLNAMIADINDANITGVTASKNASNNMVITLVIQPSTAWQYIIGAGTANNNIGLTAGTFQPNNPTSVTYFDVWQGTATNRAYKSQMDYILKHFQNLGYRIERSTNTATNTTLQWNVNW